MLLVQDLRMRSENSRFEIAISPTMTEIPCECVSLVVTTDKTAWLWGCNPGLFYSTKMPNDRIQQNLFKSPYLPD